jgi:GLPGLI family protein
MKTLFFTTAFLLLTISSIAQDFQGKAEYFSKIIEKRINNDEVAEDINPEKKEMREMLKQAMKKATEKKYELNFNKSQALYEKIVEMEAPAPNTSGISVSVSFSNEGKKFIDLKEKKSFIEDDIFGKEFLIVEDLKSYDWQMTSETKKIGEYICYKAQTVKKVTEKEKKEYQDYLKRNETKKTTGLFSISEPQDEIITAWYTPEIPISVGPNNYWGLPGLILEVSSNKEIILCTKIDLSQTGKSTLKKPSTGKKVTQKEFDDIQEKKFNSMKNEDGVVEFITD